MADLIVWPDDSVVAVAVVVSDDSFPMLLLSLIMMVLEGSDAAGGGGGKLVGGGGNEEGGITVTDAVGAAGGARSFLGMLMDDIGVSSPTAIAATGASATRCLFLRPILCCCSNLVSWW